MFSDSHTHILFTSEKIDDAKEMMASLQKEAFRFVMDIGTMPKDFEERLKCVETLANGCVPSFIHFAVGLWPHASTIAEKEASLAMLEGDIEKGLKFAIEKAMQNKMEAYFALGECGLDRYWNGDEAPMLSEGGTQDIEGEESLFKEQLKLAKKYGLAVIIHSREAYQATLKCIDEVGYQKGVIHCYSYGIEEAKEFLNRGWYISFPGNITFAKTHVAKERIKTLISFIPKDRLLLETDAPYMTPVPLRGTVNTSLNIRYTYSRAGEYLGMSVEELCDVVYQNCTALFKIN